MDDDIKSAKPIKYKLTCCRSYLTPKGRCYSCPERKLNDDSDDDEDLN